MASNSEQQEPLYYPPIEEDLPAPESSTSEPTRHTLEDRLFIGNIHPTVDEYALLQAFTKFGKITKLDYLFHKSGPLKGKPRGYAFVQYANKDEAMKAVTLANDKLLHGRKLAVKFAKEAPMDQYGDPSMLRKRKAMMETGKPTTLSLIKSGSRKNEGNTDAQIRLLESKLMQMEHEKPKASTSTDPSSSASTPSLPYHPSLPRKPPPPLPEGLVPLRMASSSSSSGSAVKPAKRSLPILPLLPSTPKASALPTPTLSTNPSTTVKKPVKTKLLGVKMKPKEKEAKKE